MYSYCWTEFFYFSDVEHMVNAFYYVVVVYVFMLILDLYTDKPLCTPTGVYFHCVLTCFVKSMILITHIWYH